MAVKILNYGIISISVPQLKLNMWLCCFHTDLFVLSSLMDFLFLEDRSSCFARSQSLRDSSESYLPVTFSLSFITSRKHGSQYATEVPAFQRLTVSSFSNTKQGIQKYSWHLKQVYFVLFKQEEQHCSSLPAIFSNLVFCVWQQRKNKRDCGKKLLM